MVVLFGDDVVCVYDVELLVFVVFIVVVDVRVEEIGEMFVSMFGSSRDNFVDIVVAFEEALDELCDECVCDGLVKFLMMMFEKIVCVVDFICGGDWFDVDFVLVVVFARERVVGYDDDVKIFIEVMKEVMMVFVCCVYDVF